MASYFVCYMLADVDLQSELDIKVNVLASPYKELVLCVQFNDR